MHSMHTVTLRKDWRIVETASDDAALDVQWDAYENIDWDRVLKGRLMANFYCFRKGAHTFVHPSPSMSAQLNSVVAQVSRERRSLRSTSRSTAASDPRPHW
jgi:hypothetical protein